MDVCLIVIPNRNPQGDGIIDLLTAGKMIGVEFVEMFGLQNGICLKCYWFFVYYRLNFQKQFKHLERERYISYWAVKRHPSI
jgi:hypothetical protein